MLFTQGSLRAPRLKRKFFDRRARNKMQRPVSKKRFSTLFTQGSLRAPRLKRKFFDRRAGGTTDL